MRPVKVATLAPEDYTSILRGAPAAGPSAESGENIVRGRIW